MKLHTADPNAIRTLIIPVGRSSLLVPNALVVEVLRRVELSESQAHDVDWLMGLASWREREIPVLAFSVLLGERPPGHKPHHRLVVLHTLNGDEKLPYLGLVATAIPKLTSLSHASFKPVDLDVNHPFVLQRVRVKGEEVVIPDLDALEAHVKQGIVL